MTLAFGEPYDLKKFVDVAYKDKENNYYYFYKKEDEIEYIVFNSSFSPVLTGDMEEPNEIDQFFYEQGIIQDVQKVSIRFVTDSFDAYAEQQHYL